MKQQLITILNNLKTDEYYAVRIVNTDTGKVICTKKHGSDMVQEAGSVDEFFNELQANGNHNFSVQELRKNGSSYKNIGDVHCFRTKDSAAKEPTLQPNVMPAMFPGLNGHGLGYSEIYTMMDHPKLLSENERIKAENIALKQKNDELKEQILQDKYSTEKSKGNSELLATLANLAGPLLKNMGAGGATPGLQAPQTNLSPVKQNLMNSITNMPESMAGYLDFVAAGMSTNQAFGDKVLTLLEEFELIPKQ